MLNFFLLIVQLPVVNQGLSTASTTLEITQTVICYQSLSTIYSMTIDISSSLSPLRFAKMNSCF